ncbi:hypothetical protein [Corynebacterium amycolatum]|uniref:hypothetical protein n=1 Tax=Corynebacterium amycolatum TaxID=43765 RepID=UPI002159FC73|nr:hypothetical protein [Corynebacterium amycolatum]UVE00689.1 hypothetical protein NU639_00600 [Corynebacterium amycolatum]
MTPTVSDGQISRLLAAQGLTIDDLSLSDLEAVSDCKYLPDLEREIQRIVYERAQEAAKALALPDGTAEFWESRPLLQHIMHTAAGWRCSPYAVLAGVLVSVASAVGPGATFPGEGSLNSFFLLTADSGGGKGKSQRVAKKVAKVKGWGMRPLYGTRIPAGTAEGLARALSRDLIEETDDEGNPTSDEPQMGPAKAIILDVPEITALDGKMAARGGDSIKGNLCAIWSAERVGTSTASRENFINVEDDSYRCCMIAGVQTENAESLLSDAVTGHVQRMVWLPATAGQGLVDFAGTPRASTITPMEIQLPEGIPELGSDEKFDLTVADEIMAEIDRFDISVQERRIKPGLDSHRYQSQLKLACLFALADSRTDVTTEDWRLAAHLMAVSVMERQRCQREIEAGKLRTIQEKARLDAARYSAQRAENERQLALKIFDVLDELQIGSIPEICRRITGSQRSQAKSLLEEWRLDGTLEADTSGRAERLYIGPNGAAKRSRLREGKH